jgi:hypothetical protein
MSQVTGLQVVGQTCKSYVIGFCDFDLRHVTCRLLTVFKEFYYGNFSNCVDGICVGGVCGV